ncbi:MAG: hypothetical protein G01um101420_413 [Parcubacteria group bacterium Gr01-1014_20]|nr:MAG: hypothetical protein G01um101420_413 [Parcubacteria group bacterium Gr01-1014_20]
MTLISYLIQSLANIHGLSGSYRFAKHFQFPGSTVWDWWNGRSQPRRAVDRKRLFELIPHAIFSGELTAPKIRQAASPPTEADRKFVKEQLGESGSDGRLEETSEKINDVAIERLTLLIQVMLPDLQTLLKSPVEIRRKAKKKIGVETFDNFLTSVRALSSDATYQVLERDHMLDKIKGGG